MSINRLLLFCCLFIALPAAGAPPELPDETPEQNREAFAAIERQTASVVSHLNHQYPDAGRASQPAQPATERDPFEVSPNLRESSRRMDNRISADEVAVLRRELKLKALARGSQGGVAQIQWDREILTINSGDELDFNGNRYIVQIDEEGLMLRGTSAPQFKIRVR